MKELFESTQSKAARFSSALIVLVILGSIFLVSKTITEVQTSKNLRKTAGFNSIYVTGKGEAFAIPDVAKITYDVTQDAKSVADAQKVVTEKMNDIQKYLESQSIDKKDIKTISYNIYPKYEYEPVGCTTNYCPSKQVFKGYTVTHSVEVTIRKTENAGAVLASLGEKKVTNVSGINFVVENEEKVKAEARAKAIADARAKAETIAKELGVDLDKVISFSENNYPVYYGRGGEMYDAKVSAAPSANPVPELPVGQSKITTEVTVTYEID